MKSVFALLGLALCNLLVLAPVSTASAQDCKKVTIKTCPSFFSERCRNDTDFLNKNGGACLGISRNRAKDQPFCAEVDMSQCKAVVPVVKVEQKDCEKIDDIVEKILCEDNKEGGFPRCASGTPELQSRFKELGNDVTAELKNFDGVLDLKPDDVKGRETLCAKSIDSMKKYYNQATNVNTPIKSFLVRSLQIASCAKDIDTWVKNQKLVIANSEFQNNLIKITGEDLAALDPLRRELNLSVKKLEEAGPKLVQLMRFHLRFCPRD